MNKKPNITLTSNSAERNKLLEKYGAQSQSIEELKEFLARVEQATQKLSATKDIKAKQKILADFQKEFQEKKNKIRSRRGDVHENETSE